MPSIPPYDERDLLLRVSQGDQLAFTRLVDLYWNRVYSHALAYSKSAPRAQEITQDIFLRLWNKRDTLPGVDDFKNFLFILGRNLIISSMRKKLHERWTNDPGDVVEDALLPDEKLQLKEAHNLLMEGIEKLPPARKRIFKMSRLEGMTYEEIAEQMNISRNTVKDHIVQALNFLRTYVHTHSDHFLFFALFILTR